LSAVRFVDIDLEAVSNDLLVTDAVQDDAAVLNIRAVVLGLAADAGAVANAEVARADRSIVLNVLIRLVLKESIQTRFDRAN
jgi:hypothetical protein